ncbi:SRPBCC domain-containing protein [Pelagibius marinus]|uniref:SRPBCC domain-containing protein n=1 Tax=Pelagibius marinus TaxID=2762760 RepID=UPI001872C556|nr:SRPBCC domain-containing protein [Pelagibius marinus]
MDTTTERKMPRGNSGATILTTPSDTELVIARSFGAPPELVFAAWTEPRHVKRWWGPHGFVTTLCEIDLRVGGAFRIEMRGPDGTIYPIDGTYREITRPSRLVYDEIFGCLGRPDLSSVVTVSFTRIAAGTDVTVHTACMSREHRDGLIEVGVERGWSETFERLSGYLPEMEIKK